MAFLEDEIRKIADGVIVAGDFNTRAVDCGMPLTKTRGHDILDMAARKDLHIPNVSDVSPFRRQGN